MFVTLSYSLLRAGATGIPAAIRRDPERSRSDPERSRAISSDHHLERSRAICAIPGDLRAISSDLERYCAIPSDPARSNAIPAIRSEAAPVIC